MITKCDIVEELKRQLSLDYNCDPEDFDQSKNVLTISEKLQGRREYISNTFFFSMVTLGGNSIIMSDEVMHPWLTEYVKNLPGHMLFEHEHLRDIDQELKKYNKRLWMTHHMFLPDPIPLGKSADFEVRWFEHSEIHELYGCEDFSNALCKEYDPNRPDVLAVAAIIDDRIAGLAGCSADTEIMWQIGIDVLPDYRNRGIGKTLVALLKDEILKREKIPFYGTSLSNLYSWNIALKTGFYPAWVEIETVE